MIEYFSELLTVPLFYAMGISVLGGLMHGYTGWGGGMVMMPLMTLIFPPTEALGIIAVGGLFLSAQMYPSAFRTANWPAMKPLYLALLVMTPLGGLLLIVLDPFVVRKMIGVFIILAALLILSGWQYRGRRGVGAAALFGTIGGLINGFSGVGGPVYVVYVIAHPDAPAVQRANIVLGAGLMILLILITLFSMGEINIDTIVKGMIVTPMQMLGGALGIRIFSVAPEENFKKFTLAAIVVLGATVVIF